VAAREALLFDAHPAVALAAAVLFEVQLAVLVLAEAGHARETLLHLFEEVQDGLAVVRQVQLRPQPHVDVEILAERVVRVTHGFSR
jgi:hypothetical protein